MLTKTLPSGTVHKLPEDMRKVILANKKLREMWEDITPLARNEWICWTITVAKPETRAKHLVIMLKKGMRRPCCWAGCLHREKTGK
jgi:uncharacterized protein YdeI (YjbR/CyaY-like superfamily)